MDNRGAASLDFAAVYREHGRQLRAAMRLHRVPARDADDVAQEAMLVLWKSLGRYDAGRPLQPWLRTILRRTARDYLEKHRRWEHVLRQPAEEHDVVAISPTAEEVIAASESQAAVGELQRSLGPIFAMAEVDGFSLREIAYTLGLPESTVRGRLRAARSKFAAAVSRYQARSAAGR